MALYQKQIRYSLYETVPDYGWNPDGYKDVLIEDTGWISEEEDTWADKKHGPYVETKTRWVTREERYAKIDAAPVVHAQWEQESECIDCTNCGISYPDTDIWGRKQLFDFCPHCGAEMDLKKEH